MEESVEMTETDREHGMPEMREDPATRGRAEKLLRESEARFRATFEQAGVGIAHVAANGRFLWLNQRFCDIVGYSPQEMLARTYQDITHPDDLDADLELARQVLAGERPSYSMEKRYIRGDGSLVWVNLTVTLVRETSGEPRHFISVVVDITARKQAEESLQERTWELGERVKELQCLYRISELIETPGISLDEILQGSVDLIPPALRYPEIACAQLVLEGRAYRTEGFQESSWKHARDLVVRGRRLGSLEVYYLEAGPQGDESPFLHEERILAGAIANRLGQAIERMRTSEDLADSSQLLETTMEHTHVLFAYLDPQLNFVRVNRAYAQADGREPSFFPGRNHFALYPNAENERIFQRVVGTGEPYYVYAKPFEYAEHPERGTTYWDWSLVPTKGVDGQVNGLVLTLADVTERIRMVEALRESEERFRTLVQSQGEGIGIVDWVERFTFANPAAERIFGVPPGELVGRHLAEFVDPASYQQVQEETERRRRGEKGTYELEIIRPDGDSRYLLVTANPQTDLGGLFAGTFGIFRDITERKQAEKALQAYSERLEEMVEERTAELVDANRQLQREIAERVAAEEALLKRNRALALLNQSAQTVNSILDLDQVLISVLEEVQGLLDVVYCSVWLIDRESGKLVCEQAAGPRSEIVHRWPMSVGEGIAGWVAQKGESLNVPDVSVDSRHAQDVDRLTGLALRSLLCVPLVVKQRIIGALQVLDAAPARFEETDLTLLELLAASAATAVENARLYEDLGRARRQWEEIFQAIGHPTLVLNAEHTIEAANRAAVRLTGRSEEELRGRKCYQVFHSRGQAAPGCPMTDLLVSGRLSTVEMEMEALGGTYLVSCTPVFGAGDRLEGVIHIATDISDLKRAREELERRNQELVTLNAVATTISQSLNLDHVLEATLDSVLDLAGVDAGWIQLFAEEEGQGEALLVAHRGISSEMVDELTGGAADAGWLRRLARSDQPIVMTGLEDGPALRSMPAETSVPSTVVGVPIRARETTLGVLGILSRGPDGMTSQAVQLLLAVGHQIGMAIENIRLLDEASELQILREVDRLRSELIANVSHELRTPLGLIKVSSTALTMDEVEFDLETQRRFLLGIEEEVGNLERIVDQLLDVSRMESSKLQVDRRPTDLGQLARRVMEAVKPQLERHVLAYEFPEDPLVASVDARQVEQVLRNLLENAIKYSPHGGTIKVQGERRGSKITVCVSDEGIGVPAEEQERIFERFYRVDNPVTRRVRGLGLGLSICQWIVEAHGGAIWVQGGPDAGSTFCFALPSGFPGLDSPPESVRV